jgi:transposase
LRNLITPYYDRLRAAGKPMKIARCACTSKLLHIAFAVVTRQHAFDPDYQSTPRLPVQKVSTAR